MIQVEVTNSYGHTQSIEVPDECVIGKSAQNEIRLDNWRIAKEHARLFNTPSGVIVEDMGAFIGVSVNGQRIDAQYGPLKSTDVINIAAFNLRVVENTHDDHQRKPHPFADNFTDNFSATQLDENKRNNTGTHESLASNRQGNHASCYASSDVFNGDIASSDLEKKLEFEWRQRLHNKLLETIDLRRHDIHGMTDERLRKEADSLIRQILEELRDEIPATLDHELLCKQVINEAVGLGPLEELLNDDSVSEIMVNRFDEIYVERAGRLHRYPLTFTGDRAVMGVIERIVAPLGRRIDESSPMVDARLKDGSRVNAIIPPLALKGPCLTIRKFSKRKLEASDLVQFGSISQAMAEFLKICVESRKNIIVSGGTGSGKTTLLNILSNFIPAHERIITVEDAAELKLHHDHLISLESRPANLEGKGAILIRDLVKNTLRMRPDRIVVGECRGAEALDMLQAMNTGHEGSLTTLHANTPRDALARLETMILMAGMELPLSAIREQIASAVDIIVQQTRFACGSRMITHIVEITGMESGTLQLQELFKFTHQGYHPDTHKTLGFFTGCNMVPSFYEELQAIGHPVDMSLFQPHSAYLEDSINAPHRH
ncbi:MAG: ATPase, T2SS/T4P/T4SS family [Pseudomonadota bacterium]